MGCVARLFVLACIILVASPAAAQTKVDWEKQWFVDATTALKLAEDGATVLDTRGAIAFTSRHLPGAVRVKWQDFSRVGESQRGNLLPRKRLQEAIRAVGVSHEKPVIVVGDPPDDWGEDGRIVWMLRSAGHNKVALVDGGVDALERAGAKWTNVPAKPSPGDFVVGVPRFTAAAKDLLEDGVLLIDTREPREFAGATPYGEARGGHVPGAKNLHLEALMNPDGTLRSKDEIRAVVATLGGSTTSPVIAYCTGGVRSGWMVAALKTAGFTAVRNYAGSMWEWSAGDPKKHPLQTD